MTTLKAFLLMSLFLFIAALLLALFWLVERATRPEVLRVRPGYYVEVSR